MAHLTYGLHSPCDLLKKLKFEAERLKQNFNSYDFFNFVVTAYHLCDWVEKNFGLRKGDILNSYLEIQICKDLANASKHFGIDPNHPASKKYPPITSHADSVSGYGVGRYGCGGYRIGEEKIIIEIEDTGTGKIETFDAYDLVNKVVEIWENILSNYCP